MIESFLKSVEIRWNDIKLKLKELIDVKIIDLKRIDFIMARPIKSTENSKIKICDSLSKINSNQSILARVDSPKIGCAYLGKWDDDCYYRAELLEILSDGSFKVVFIDESTSNDIVSELRQIPTGNKQQYLNQFVKLSLGEADDDDLKEFILREPEGKVVKIYWLGEEASPGVVPLVNLLFDEDEVLERFSAVRKRQIKKWAQQSMKRNSLRHPATSIRSSGQPEGRAEQYFQK